LQTYKELDTEYNIIIISPQRPHSGEFGDLMTKMVERGGGRGIQLILSAVNPEISELSILGGRVF